MKRLFGMICVLIFVLSGCSKTTQLSHLPLSVDPTDKRSINTEDFMPVLFYDFGSHRDHVLILCGFQDGEFRAMSDYTYNGKNWNDFSDGKTSEIIEADFIQKNGNVAFYNSRGERNSTAIQDVRCVGRAKDEFTEIQAILSPNATMEGGYQIGLHESWDPYPREVRYSADTMTVDLDGNGVDDQIRWSFVEPKNAPEGDYFDCSMSVDLNGKTFVYRSEADLPCAKEDWAVFAIDLNNDGIMEIVVYEKSLSVMSSVIVYQIVDGKMEPMLNYTLNPGP